MARHRVERQMANRKMFILLGLSVLSAVSGTSGVPVRPDNPLTNLFGRHISDDWARIVIGPYSAECDFRLLKLNTWHAETSP